MLDKHNYIDVALCSCAQKANSNVKIDPLCVFRPVYTFELGIDRQQHIKHRPYMDMGMGVHCVLIPCWRTCDSLFMNSTSICLSLWGAMK